MTDKAIFISEDDGSILWASEDAQVVADAREHGIHLSESPEARAALMRADMDRTHALALAEPDDAHRAAQERAKAILADMRDRRPEGDDLTDAHARANKMKADLARAGMRFSTGTSVR